MKLTDRVFDRVLCAERRYGGLKRLFCGFFQGATLLTQPSGLIKSVTLYPSLDHNFFDVFFSGIQVRFSLVVGHGPSDSLRAKVAITRRNISLANCGTAVGAFSFDEQGQTDFRDTTADNSLDIQHNAVGIVLHFLDRSLWMESG